MSGVVNVSKLHHKYYKKSSARLEFNLVSDEVVSKLYFSASRIRDMLAAALLDLNCTLPQNCH